MPFWTVGDAGPYKEKSNFLMRSPLCRSIFYFFIFSQYCLDACSFLEQPYSKQLAFFRSKLVYIILNVCNDLMLKHGELGIFIIKSFIIKALGLFYVCANACALLEGFKI